MMVVGAGGSSSGRRWGRLAPQVKQMRSPGLTSAAQAGQVTVAMDILQDSYQISVTVRSHESVTCRADFVSTGSGEEEGQGPAGRRVPRWTCAAPVASGACRQGASYLQRGRDDQLPAG